MNLPTDYILHLADTSLVLGHRNSEWCGHGPVLEQDIAITNISLDLIGQARQFYQYAAIQLGPAYDEDKLAYFRDPAAFKNLLLTEQPRGDWAHTILRQFYFSNYQWLVFEKLTQCGDAQAAAIAEKSLKEIAYHLRWSSEWVIRLGDGTVESRQRLEVAVAFFKPCLAELFTPAPFENFFADNDLPYWPQLQTAWLQRVKDIFEEADNLSFTGIGVNSIYGKQGQHTPHLQSLLAEMQQLPRNHPDAVW